MVAATPTVGIIAGSGTLPARLASSVKLEGRRVFVVKIKGHADDPALDHFPHCELRLGAAGKLIAELRKQFVRDVVLAGGVERPSLLDVRPDWRGAMFLAKIAGKSLGDDSLLTAVRKALEDEGFRIIGAHELATDILTPEGLIGSIAPPPEAQADIRRGVEVAKAIGMLDVGQGVIVQQGMILGVEAIEGTDELIARCAPLQRSGAGGILVKVKKPQQDDRLDLPTMGVETVRRASEAGLQGIVMEAGGTLMLDRDSVAAAADRAGLFVLGLRISEKLVPNIPRMAERKPDED